MKSWIQTLEPLWWALFVSGTFLSALLLPGVLLMVGLAGPVGIGNLDYGRIHDLASGLVGRLVALLLVYSCLWNGAHHLRHFNIDMGGLGRDLPVSLVVYGIASLGTLLALVAVIRF